MSNGRRFRGPPIIFEDQQSRRYRMAGPETDSAKPKPDAAKTSAAGGGDATRYVGTPAVGTSKAAASAGLATVGPEASRVNERRRRLVWVAVTGFLGAWFIARSEERR